MDGSVFKNCYVEREGKWSLFGDNGVQTIGLRTHSCPIERRIRVFTTEKLDGIRNGLINMMAIIILKI